MVFEHDYENFPELSNSQMEQLQYTSPHEQITRDFRATVVKVHDGDTVTLKTGFRDFDFPLRLLDIDAPELSEGGDEARDWLNTKILNAEVDILIDPTQRVGKYGRLLGRVLHNGMDVGQEQLHLGLVKEFGSKKEGQVPPIDKVFNKKQWQV